jgi:hypothetical protein
MTMTEQDGRAGLFDPDFCESRCPICTRARRGSRIAKILQSLELLVTFGGCPWGRARRRKYGVRPDEPIAGDR